MNNFLLIIGYLKESDDVKASTEEVRKMGNVAMVKITV